MARGTRAALTAAALTGVVLVVSPAGAQSANERRAQCELSAIGSARSAVAIQTIRSACNWLANNGDSLLNRNLVPYYQCLVQKLSGVQDDAAAAAIISACRAAYLR